jgi:serine/threonine protein kinase
MMPLSQGQILQNRYRIVRLIGQGGFGAVYRAWDMAVNRPCALKENLDISAEAQRQFEREATMLANLHHANLPRVTDYFFIAGQGQYLVMDFVEGQSLDDILAQKGQPLAEQEVLPWIEQVCQALHYLHHRTSPIIHRDVKPQNIVLTPDNQVMLVDFGISKLYDPQLRTTSGARAVSPGFSPIEQYGQGRTDARSDIYALGATLYTLLTNQIPPESVDRLAGSKL